MIKKLAKHGNSYALVFPKTLMELLHMKASTPLELTIVDGKIVIEPVVSVKKIKKISTNPKVQKAFEQVLCKYSPALKKLAQK